MVFAGIRLMPDRPPPRHAAVVEQTGERFYVTGRVEADGTYYPCDIESDDGLLRMVGYTLAGDYLYRLVRKD